MIIPNIVSELNFTIGSFMAPIDIGTNGWSLFFAIPLIITIAVAYKATKLEKIELKSFIKESVLLSGSIVAFMTIAAIAIFAVMKLTVG